MKPSPMRHEYAGLSPSFQNGHVEFFDVVIGADGIFGSVRQDVVEHQKCAPRRVGFWDSRNLVAYEKAISTPCTQHLDLAGKKES